MSSPEQKLKRFLHYGREIPVYEPGDRFLDDLYHPRELSSVDALIASEKYSHITSCIVKAFSDGYSAHPQMLVYALAICAKQKTSAELTRAAYKAVKTVCASPENLFLFIKFATKLSPTNSVWGSGFRKVVKNWYLNADPKTLAKIVTKNNRFNGWSHKDIIKLVHLKTNTPAKEAIVKYILYDLAKAKEECGDVPGASELFNYIQSIKDFKHMTDEQQAARTLETLHLTLDHVPSHLLKSREVWNALVHTLPLGVLIKNLERIGYLGFLKSNSPLVATILDALRDERSIAESHLHPAQVFIYLVKYETSSKFMAAVNAQKKRKTENGSGESRKVVKVPPKPNESIISAMFDLIASTCKLFLAPTGMRYMVVIDLKHSSSSRQNGKCYKCPHVTPVQAAAVTTMCLLLADRNITVVAPEPSFQKSQSQTQQSTEQVVDADAIGENEAFVPLQLTSSMTIQGGLKQLFEHFEIFGNWSSSRRTPVSALKSALLKKEEYDVFLWITNQFNKGENNCNIVSALDEYRKEMNLPKAKLITLSLMGHVESTNATPSDDPGIFDILGFDGNVPRIIEAFSRGAF